MLLVVAGDSNSFGSESLKDFDYSSDYNPYYAFGGWLTRAKGWSYKNISRPGCTNIEIVDNVLKFINTNNFLPEETIIIVGWTEPGRINLGKTLDEKLVLTPITCLAYQTNLELPFSIQVMIEKLKIIDPDKEFCRVYYEKISSNPETLLSNFFNRLLLDQILNKLNAKYLTFPTLSSNIPEYLIRYKNLFSNKNNIFEKETVQDLDGKTVDFNFMRMFEKYGKAKGNHLKASAHKSVSKWILKELVSRQIIN